MKVEGKRLCLISLTHAARRDYKAENQLLGRLLQDMKAEQDRTAEHIAGLRRQLADTSARAERAESQVCGEVVLRPIAVSQQRKHRKMLPLSLAQLEKSQSLSQRSVEDLAEARSAQERAYKEVGELKARLAEAQTALASSQREVGALQARLDGAERAGREGESARLQVRFREEPHSRTCAELLSDRTVDMPHSQSGAGASLPPRHRPHVSRLANKKQPGDGARAVGTRRPPLAHRGFPVDRRRRLCRERARQSCGRSGTSRRD